MAWVWEFKAWEPNRPNPGQIRWIGTRRYVHDPMPSWSWSQMRQHTAREVKRSLVRRVTLLAMEAGLYVILAVLAWTIFHGLPAGIV